MASESGTFRHVAEVHKWSEEQTAEAARHHGVDPDDLTHEHFTALGWTPDEHLTVDHEAGTVKHTTRDQAETYSIDEWNARHA